MSQVNVGIRAFFEKPLFYDLFQYLVGGTKARERCIREFVRPQSHMSILDIGCGTGAILQYLPRTIKYYGIDISQNYINQAKRRYGDRGTFICSDLNEVESLPKFDLILAMGVLHHLENDEVLKLFQVAQASMDRHSRLITLDGCFIENQSLLARLILKCDRGQNVRRVDGYHSLAERVFSKVKHTVLHDMLNLPTTILIMECLNSNTETIA